MTKYSKFSDEEIIKKAVKGDKEVFGVLVERYESKLLRYASYLVKDGDVAADSVQDAFIKAYVNLKGFDTSRKFSSWIYRIVHNEVINKVKRGNRFISLDAISFSKKLVEADDNIERLTRKEVKVVVRKGLSELDVKYSEPLALYYLEDKKYEEISDILRISMGTVGTRIMRGKKKLAEIVISMKG